MRFLPCVLLLILTLAVAVPAHAKDFEEAGRVQDALALCAKIDAAAKATDRDALAAAFKQVPALHNQLRTKSAIAKLQKALGNVLHDKEQNVVARKLAAETFGDLFDERGVWAQLKKALPSPKEENVDQVGVAVLTALAKVQSDRAIGSLQSIAKAARDAVAARLAIRALGEYSYSKKRAGVLKFLIQEITRIRPGRHKDIKGRINTERYLDVRDAVVSALNRLTRRNVDGVEPWLELYKANKKTPEKLFRTQLK